MTVKAENAWGNKEITVVSNMYLFTKVKPDPEVTHAKILQENLDTLVTLNEQYDKAIIVAKSQKELDGLTFNQNKIQKLQQSIQKDLENI
jgi:5-bromo-4-chloroindolyl phosphate hydrolysis protein